MVALIITRSPAQQSACKGLERNGQSPVHRACVHLHSDFYPRRLTLTL
ncbi:Hypothetical protein LOCK900_2232 [Lacticaseibacillus rhamnosus LOCK900]|nr:Hypothetical protein LOCK900_2232 [Lacticaseibacillus rhamnosus LOCK900]